MEEWQKDLLSTFAEKKLKEATEWLFCEWRGDIRDIPKLFEEIYTSCTVAEWIGEELHEVEMLTRNEDYPEELPDGYIDEYGDWIAYPWGEDDA